MLYKILIVIVGFFFRIFFRIDVEGLEHIEENQKLIICSNHLHVFDPVIISIIFPGQIHWMGKKELFENRFLGALFTKLGAFPVDREVGLSALRKSMKILKNDEVLGIFPEGTRVKELDYKNAKPGVALLAIKTKTAILPVHIDANYRIFSKVKVNIGKSFEFDQAYGENLSSEDYKKYGEEVLYRIYKLESKG